MQTAAGWVLIAGGLMVIGVCLLQLVGVAPFDLLARRPFSLMSSDLVRWPLEAAALYAIYVGIELRSREAR